MYLLARYVFESLGYRRYEWKCNALNAPSVRAARRLGFTFEGIFRQHMLVKGRNRDTAWFSMLDREWPARKAAFQRWLRPRTSTLTVVSDNRWNRVRGDTRRCVGPSARQKRHRPDIAGLERPLEHDSRSVGRNGRIPQVGHRLVAFDDSGRPGSGLRTRLPSPGRRL